MNKDPQFFDSKDLVVGNLEAIQITLNRCVEEGMIDLGDTQYNQIVDLIEDAKIVDNWAELNEIISLAKTLETDVAAWLSYHGRTTVSLSWPEKQSL